MKRISLYNEYSELNKQLVIAVLVDMQRLVATATPAGPVCPHCGRICASDFGLRSHLCVHLWPYDRQSHQYNVIVENNGLLYKRASKNSQECCKAWYCTWPRDL